MNIKELYQKHKDIIKYIIFGAATTVISIVSYHLFYGVLSLQNVPSNIISWVLAVSFAFITNKLFVFERRSWAKAKALREAAGFFLARLATGILETVFMYLLVDIAHFNGTVMKCIVTVIVIALNYIISKFWVFK